MFHAASHQAIGRPLRGPLPDTPAPDVRRYKHWLPTVPFDPFVGLSGDGACYGALFP